MPDGYIVSHNPSGGFGFIRPEKAETDAGVTATKTPQDQAADGDLVLFHDGDRVNPGAWLPVEGLPVCYELTDRHEDLYRVVVNVEPNVCDGTEQVDEGTMRLDADDPASYSSEAAL
jgi:hypothetical protein